MQIAMIVIFLALLVIYFRERASRYYDQKLKDMNEGFGIPNPHKITDVECIYCHEKFNVRDEIEEIEKTLPPEVRFCDVKEDYTTMFKKECPYCDEVNRIFWVERPIILTKKDTKFREKKK